MTDDAPRPPKKTELLEVRIDSETKRDFIAACRAAGRTASDVVRDAIAVFVSGQTRLQPQGGPLVMMIPTPIRKKRYLIAGLAAAAGIGALAMLPSAAAYPDLKAVFQHKIDTNGDGVVTPEEFFGAKLSKDAVAKTRQAMRSGKPASKPRPDGLKVSFDTYVFVFPRPAGDPEGDWGLQLSVSGNVENPPAGFDSNTFDPMTVAEFDPVASAFIEMDANEDDTISYAEFETRFNAMLARSFNRLDRNKDGYLAEMEFIRTGGWMADTTAPRTDPHATDDLLKAGFRKLDANADGKVSLAEYLMK
jgi:Ca2+-binding EF-hand superfamily protein